QGVSLELLALAGERIPVDEAHPVGDLFRRAYNHALALFHGLDEAGGLHEAFVRSCVKPGHPTAKLGHYELLPLEIDLVDVRDLDLASRGRLDRGGDVQDILVVKIEPGKRQSR